MRKRSYEGWTRKRESRLACSYLKVRPSHFSFIFLAITKYHRSFFPTRTTPSRNLKFRAHDETLSIAIKVSWNPSYHTQSRSAGHTIYIYISGELEIKGKSLTKTRRAGALSSFLTFLPFFPDSQEKRNSVDRKKIRRNWNFLYLSFPLLLKQRNERADRLCSLTKYIYIYIYRTRSLKKKYPFFFLPPRTQFF